MSESLYKNIPRAIHQLFATASGAGTTDDDLLRRFVQGHDEAAFELLVWRHAGLVWQVCRQTLRDEQAVEDAFQATFLVLIRKAGSVLRGEALPGWLHRVAFRVALRARPRRQIQTGVDLDTFPTSDPAATIEEDQRLMLHEEIARLPARYRLPIVCCFLEGRTHEEAASALGWKKGTVAGRLARAKELLRHRLARRGVTLGTSVVAGELSTSLATAAVSRRVVVLLSAVRGVLGKGSTAVMSLSPEVVALAEGVVTAMFHEKIKGMAFVMVLVGVGGLAAGGVWHTHTRTSQAREAPQEQRAEVNQEGGGDWKREQAPEKAEDPLVEVMARAKMRRNLRELALAMHNYHAAHGHLPAPAITDARGKPLLSWRVELLPYLGEHELYKQFKLNEPWDSPHNKKLLAKMPEVFAPVLGKSKESYATHLQLLVGPTALFPGPHLGLPGGMPGMGSGMMGEAGAGNEGAMGGPPPRVGGPSPGSRTTGVGGGSSPAMGGTGMPPEAGGSGARGSMGGGMTGFPMPVGRGPRFTEVSDGLSNTILIVEAGQAVPWTKPEDVIYSSTKPIPQLGGLFTHVFHVALADGSVHSLPRTIAEARLRALITAWGGEPISVDAWQESISPVSKARKQAMEKLRSRNRQLKEEAAILGEILKEVRAEVENLRWTMEEEKLLALDPAAAKLRQENAELERSMREARDEVRKLMQEVRQLREAVPRGGKK